MKPTRQTQPYRQGARSPGMALTAMLRGRTPGGMNPMDVHRAAQMMGKRPWWQVGGGRRPRPQRAARPQRPPR